MKSFQPPYDQRDRPPYPYPDQYATRPPNRGPIQNYDRAQEARRLEPQQYQEPTRTIPYGTKGVVPPYQRLEKTLHLDEERKAVVRHLERLIERERGQGIAIQEQFADQVQQVKLRIAEKKQKLETKQSNLAALEEEHQLLLAESNKIESQIRDSLAKKQDNARRMGERLDDQQKNITEMERKYAVELNQYQTEHFNHLRDLDQEWGRKCDDLMDKNRIVDDSNQDILRRINDVKDDMHAFNQDSHATTTDLIEKIKKLVMQEFKEKLNIMETQINRLDEERMRINRSNKDTLTEAQKSLRDIVEEYEFMMKDKVRLGLENQTAQYKNKQYELFNTTLAQESQNKVKLIKLLAEELDELKAQNENCISDDREQMETVMNNHLREQNLHIKEVETLRQRAEALIKLVRDNELDNARLYGDLNRITELLQANSSKAIYQTFAENKMI